MRPFESERPVIIVGHGVRAAGAAHLVPRLLDLGVPVLCSWQAADMVDPDHENAFGRPGVYGQRCANKVLYNADAIVAIGCRLSPFTIGHHGLRKDQLLMMADIDEAEAKKFPGCTFLRQDAKNAIEILLAPGPAHEFADWLAQCRKWKAEYPWLDSAHVDVNGHPNTYRFIHALPEHLAPDAIVVTDMGTALTSAFQSLKIKPPQRLLTSGGLGEMGVALPAAIGASFATGRGPVLCLSCDGGMMLNLQELQTIAHHQLPVKIIVFSNDGYLMLKHTQKAQGMMYAGVDKMSGLSCPSYRKLAYALDIPACDIHSWADAKTAIPQLFAEKGPALVEFFMDPEQPLVPKIGYQMKDGNPVYAQLDELSP